MQHFRRILQVVMNGELAFSHAKMPGVNLTSYNSFTEYEGFFNILIEPFLHKKLFFQGKGSNIMGSQKSYIGKQLQRLL
jgi:hypothetical protein